MISTEKRKTAPCLRRTQLNVLMLYDTWSDLLYTSTLKKKNIQSWSKLAKALAVLRISVGRHHVPLKFVEGARKQVSTHGRVSMTHEFASRRALGYSGRIWHNGRPMDVRRHANSGATVIDVTPVLLSPGGPDKRPCVPDRWIAIDLARGDQLPTPVLRRSLSVWGWTLAVCHVSWVTVGVAAMGVRCPPQPGG